MSQFIYVVSPPETADRCPDWGFVRTEESRQLVDVLLKQDLDAETLQLFRQSWSPVYRGDVLNESPFEHHYSQNGEVIWQTKFPELVEDIVRSCPAALFFYGRFEHCGYVFKNVEVALGEIQDQLRVFPVELNLLVAKNSIGQ